MEGFSGHRLQHTAEETEYGTRARAQPAALDSQPHSVPLLPRTRVSTQQTALGLSASSAAHTLMVSAQLTSTTSSPSSWRVF